jgi:predicted ArsR family transcriptional regulator
VSALTELDVKLERDVFFRTLIRELSGVLQDVVGLDEAAGFVSVVGQQMGREIGDDYAAALHTDHLTPEQIGAVLVDLKRRIGGEFSVLEQTDEKIVFVNSRCPFNEKVLGRPAMCMMTSNVFGSIAARNIGYAKVVLHETIAQGDPGCRVTVYLKPSPESDAQNGREYFDSTTE